jgi:hypothetical protein
MHSSTSTPNFDGYQSYSGGADAQYVGGYQSYHDQKEAFFSKKQAENATRPEYVLTL